MGARPQRGTGSRRSAAGRTCERCGAAVFKQLVGHRAALNVIADVEPMPPTAVAALVEPNRLAWCLARLYGGGTELRWRCRHECGHDAVIEHRCPEGTPAGRRPEGALW